MIYRDKAQKWATVLLVILAVHAVLNLGLMATSYIQIGQLERIDSEEVTEEKIASNVARFVFLAYAKAALFWLTIIVWLTWLYRAYRALAETGSRTMDQSPRWAVGCWFIPLVNFLHPFRITRELWLRSETQNADAVAARKEPPLVALWWLLFLGNGVLARIAERQNDESIEGLISATRWVLYSGLCDLASAAAAFALVLSLKRMQARWSDGANLAEVF